MRDFLRQSLAQAGLKNVNEDDLATLEAQLARLQQSAEPLSEYCLNDVVPAILFRPEGEGESE